MKTKSIRRTATRIFCTGFLLCTFLSSALAAHITWTQLFPANSPSARLSPAMAYDAVSQKIVLFGGYDGSNYLNDTWTFDGTNWTQVNTSVAPPVRTNASMAYDTRGKKLVLFGGYDGNNYLGDTWVFDGATQSWISVPGATGPKAVTGPMLFPDPVNHRVDNFGGFDGQFYQLTTYRWTGETWQKLSTRTSPSARSSSAVGAYVPNNQIILFCGLGDVNPYNTWAWDGTQWTQQFPAAQPESLYSPGAAYHPGLHALIVFGGGNGGVDVNDTWKWADGNWTQLLPPQSPPPREGHGMAFFPPTGNIIIFGGLQQTTILGDTWELTK